MSEVLHDIADERGEINRRKLGRWIKRHAGRIVDGRRFLRSSGNRSAEAWRVDVVESVSPVLPVSPLPEKKSVSVSNKQKKVEIVTGKRTQLSLFGAK